MIVVIVLWPLLYSLDLLLFFSMFSFVLRLRDTAAADALFSEAYACLDQGLCYEECNDRVSVNRLTLSYDILTTLTSYGEICLLSQLWYLFRHVYGRHKQLLHNR